MALSVRELKSQLRETGEISSHNPGFTKQNLSSFPQAVQAAKRAG